MLCTHYMQHFFCVYALFYCYLWKTHILSNNWRNTYTSIRRYLGSDGLCQDTLRWRVGSSYIPTRTLQVKNSIYQSNFVLIKQNIDQFISCVRGIFHNIAQYSHVIPILAKSPVRKCGDLHFVATCRMDLKCLPVFD